MELYIWDIIHHRDNNEKQNQKGGDIKMGIFDKLFKPNVEKLEKMTVEALTAMDKLWEEGCRGTYDISERRRGMKIINAEIARNPEGPSSELYAELYAKRAFIKHFSISLEDSSDKQNEQDVKEALARDPNNPLALFVGGAIYFISQPVLGIIQVCRQSSSKHSLPRARNILDTP